MSDRISQRKMKAVELFRLTRTPGLTAVQRAIIQQISMLWNVLSQLMQQESALETAIRGLAGSLEDLTVNRLQYDVEGAIDSYVAMLEGEGVLDPTQADAKTAELEARPLVYSIKKQFAGAPEISDLKHALDAGDFAAVSQALPVASDWVNGQINGWSQASDDASKYIYPQIKADLTMLQQAIQNCANQMTQRAALLAQIVETEGLMNRLEGEIRIDRPRPVEPPPSRGAHA